MTETNQESAAGSTTDQSPTADSGKDKLSDPPMTLQPPPRRSTEVGQSLGVPPKPSMGRTVIVRESGRTAPATIVDVREDGSIDVQIFRADHMVHAAHRLFEIGPDDESADGWFWPPRV